MPIRPSLRAGLLVLGLGVLGSPAWAAPSFDCKAASTPVEKTICANPGLSNTDQEIADAYKALQGLSGSADRDRLRAEQRVWLGQRNQCVVAPGSTAAATACLAELFDARKKALTEATAPAVAAVAGIVDSLASDPAGAGRRLAELSGGLGKGWSAYAARFSPQPDHARAQALLTEAVGRIEDDYARETAMGVDAGTDDGFLTALRVVSDEYEMAWPCSVMTQRGLPAWKAMEPLYGSSRDTFGALPACPDSGALLDSAPWKAVDALLAPMLEAASSRTGTVRSATYRQMEVDRLKSAVDPRLFVKDAPDPAPLLADVAGWRNPRWIPAGWAETVRAAVDGAVNAWAPQLASRYGLSADEARRVARAVVAQGMATGVGLIADNLDLQGDSRLPDWLRGTWTWTGAAEDTPFASASGKARIDATDICVGNDCTEFELTERGAAIDPKDVKALGVTLSPAAAKQAVGLAPLTAGMPLTAAPLVDGRVLAVGSGKATLLTRVGK